MSYVRSTRDVGRGARTCSRVKVGDLKALLEQLNAWDEGGALDAVLVQFVWVTTVLQGQSDFHIQNQWYLTSKS